MKTIRRLLLAAVALPLLAALVVYLFLRASLAETRGTLLVSGLERPVTVERQRWGVPQLTAESLGDLCFATGFVHAQDRLFQMDLTRRAATGRLAELFGPDALEWDGARRDELPGEAIARSRAALPRELAALLDAYCRGVNAFIDSQNLPPEFHLLRSTPARWRIDDVLAVLLSMETMLAESGAELYNARVFRAIGADKARALLFGNLGSAIVDAAELGRMPPAPALGRRVERERHRLESRLGSNNWVVSGSRTAGGTPLLANDPHLPTRFPSHFYQVVARAPGLEVSGLSLPGTPFVVIGRNRHVGWGFTSTGTDVIDYFSLRTQPGHPDRYLFDGQWRDIARRRETIRVRGRAAVTREVRVSLAGPLVEEENRLLAHHAIEQSPLRTLEAILLMNRARDAGEFVRALRLFTAPAMNVVFADTAGTIGYYPAGWVPLRARGNGALPARAEGREDLWQGFLDEARKPLLLNPGCGFVVTANNPVLPEGHEPIFSLSWIPSFRADRIRELLEASPRLTLEDMKAIQCDTYLKSAEFLLQRTASVPLQSAKAASIRRALQAWDLRADSGRGPFLFYRFERHLRDALLAHHLRPGGDRELLSTTWLYRLLGYPAAAEPDRSALNAWADDPATPRRETFAEAVERSLVETFNDYRASAHANPDGPAWESLHTLTYRHPLGSVFLLKPFLNRGPYPMAGGLNCVMTAAFDDNYRVIFASTFRMILDFSNAFSPSLLVNSSGQSGHFLSPFYDDQAPLFTAAKYRPMEDRSPAPRRLVLKPADE